METRLLANCSTFALKPCCHCPNPLSFLLLACLQQPRDSAGDTLPTLGPGFVLLFLTVWYLTHFPTGSLASFLLYLLLCISLTLVSHFKQVSGFFAFPCICHDLPLNGVHPPEQSYFFQCISCSLCLPPPLCSRMSAVRASCEPAVIVTRVIRASLQGSKSFAKLKPLNLKNSVFPTKNQVSIIGLPRLSDRCKKSLSSYGLDSNLIIQFSCVLCWV